MPHASCKTPKSTKNVTIKCFFLKKTVKWLRFPRKTKENHLFYNFFSIDIVQTIVNFLRIENHFCIQNATQSTYKFNKNKHSQKQIQNKNLY